jgi:hypothetical protein
MPRLGMISWVTVQYHAMHGTEPRLQGLEVRKAKAVAKKPAKAPVKAKPVVVCFYFSSVISRQFSHPTFI